MLGVSARLETKKKKKSSMVASGQEGVTQIVAQERVFRQGSEKGTHAPRATQYEAGWPTASV